MPLQGRFHSRPYLKYPHMAVVLCILYPCSRDYLHFCSKPSNAHWHNMLYHMLIFTNMFRPTLRPSSVCLTRIKILIVTANGCTCAIWATVTGLTINNCTLCPHCIYMLCIYLRTNSDLCPIHWLAFYNLDEKCLLRGTNWVF